MGGEWVSSAIGKQVTLQRGIDITRAGQRAGRVPVVSSGGVASYHDTAAVKGPGVVLGRKGVVGSVYYVPTDYWPHDTTLWVKDFHGNEPRFVYYFFRWMAPRLAAMDVGSANPTLNRNHVHPIVVRWPPLPEQKRIAHILGTLDDKIELNRRMCQTLEEMARALFKSWFVDFDPVRAKAEGRQPAGMDAATAALFPDSFVDSELGPIPKGWEVRSLGDEFEVTMGQSPPGQTYNSNGDGLPFYQGRADFGFRFPALRIYCTAPTRLANKGDTLLSVRAPVGDLNVALFNCAIGRGVAALRHRSGAASYTYHSLQAHQDDLLLFEANGTVFGSVSGKELAAVRLVAPPDVLAKQFATSVGPLDDEIENRTVQSQGLANVRDALLPRLLGREERQG